MAKQFVNIGIEGNDGTGDSIRDVLNKVNENHRTVCSIWSRWSNSHSSLSDTPTH